MANTHPNQNPDFSMTTVGSQRYNLHHQIYEGLVIEEAAGVGSGTTLLNSKGEWNRAKLYRINIQNSQG